MEEQDIREKLNSLLMSRKQLADKVCVDYSYFTKFLKGEISLGKNKLKSIKNWLEK